MANSPNSAVVGRQKSLFSGALIGAIRFLALLSLRVIFESSILLMTNNTRHIYTLSLIIINILHNAFTYNIDRNNPITLTIV